MCVCMCACVVTHMLTTLSNGMAETDTTTLPRAYTTDRLRMVLHTHRGRDERKTNRMMPIIHTTTAEQNTKTPIFPTITWCLTITLTHYLQVALQFPTIGPHMLVYRQHLGPGGGSIS